MSAALESLECYSHRERKPLSSIARAIGSRMGKIFGCKHKEMSRPFSRQGETFRVCISCGARRQFDADTWHSAGRYYFKPARTSDLQDVNTSALRCV